MSEPGELPSFLRNGGGSFSDGNSAFSTPRPQRVAPQAERKTGALTRSAACRKDIGLLAPRAQDVEPHGLLKESSALFQNNLEIAEAFINRAYMPALREAEVTVPDAHTANTRNALRLLPITKFVYEEEEDINDKLMNVYSALHDDGSRIVLILRGTEENVTVYLGSMNPQATSSDQLLTQSFCGNFPGSTFGERLPYSDIERLLRAVTSSDVQEMPLNVSCVTAVPAPRTDGQGNKYQYLDQFIDTMRGKEYVAMLIATPVSNEMLESRITGFERLYSELSPYAEQSFAHQISENETVSTGASSTFSKNVSQAVSESTGSSVSDSTTRSTSTSLSQGHSSGSSSGYNFSFGEGSSSNYSSNSSDSESTTRTSSDGTTHGVTTTKGNSTTSTTGSGTAETTNSSRALGKGTSRTVTVTRCNKKVQEILDQTEQQIRRLRESKVFGVWECAAYFMAEKMIDSTNAANAFRALLVGDKSTSEQSYVTEWEAKKSVAHTRGVLAHLRHASHPMFDVNMLGNGVQFREQVSPTSLLSGKELPLFLSMPRVSVNGLPVVQMASFGRSITKIDPGRSGNAVKEFPVGCIYHRGIKESRSVVRLDADNLTSHTFVTGATGSGKSNTTYRLLESLYERHQIPFLVIEPAKGEYKSQFAKLKGINIFTTQDTVNRLLHINPFAFPEGIQLLEHLDRLLEIFKACWEMTAAMPALLKKSLEVTYNKVGWDLTASVNVLSPDKPVFPTFRDLLATLREVIENSDYSSEVKGNYKGSLVSRVESLTNGIIGQVFCSATGNTDAELFDEPAVVDLSRIGAAETKALLMGVLVMRLNEHRVVSATEMNSKLRHITVLEEAHNLLPRINGGSGGSGNNLQAKSVEMISNSIAEMRTYGEGFLIVDQSPSAVSEAAIRNTNTKIIMRLPDAEDGRTAGLSIGLNENQIREIAKFPQGVAAVKQSSWVESVLVKIDAASNPYQGEPQVVDAQAARAVRAQLWRYAFSAILQGTYQESEMQRLIMESGLTEDKKKDMCMLLPAIREALEEAAPEEKPKKRNDLYRAFVHLLGVENLLSVFEPYLSANARVLPLPTQNLQEALQALPQQQQLALSRVISTWLGKCVKALATYLRTQELDNREVAKLLEWMTCERYAATDNAVIRRWYKCINIYKKKR